MSLSEQEYVVLRQTIASRGTVRVVLLPLTLLGWASLSVVVLVFAELPVAAVLSLAVLVGGFEAIHALHVAVERIGRYLQVYYETDPAGPHWEQAVMAVGPSLPGGGIDPLFTLIFVCAALINLLEAVVPGPTHLEIGVVGAFHVLFIYRVIRARGAAARQRAVELESFRALKDRGDGVRVGG